MLVLVCRFITQQEVKELLTSCTICSYEKVLRFTTALANSVAEKTVENNGVYIPTGIDPSKQVYFAIDNTDISSKSRHGDFHGTATVVYQSDQQLNHRVAISAGKQEKNGKSWKKTLFSKSAGKAGIYIHFLQPVLEKLEKCPFSSG